MCWAQWSMPITPTTWRQESDDHKPEMAAGAVQQPPKGNKQIGNLCKVSGIYRCVFLEFLCMFAVQEREGQRMVQKNLWSAKCATKPMQEEWGKHERPSMAHPSEWKISLWAFWVLRIKKGLGRTEHKDTASSQQVQHVSSRYKGDKGYVTNTGKTT